MMAQRGTSLACQCVVENVTSETVLVVQVPVVHVRVWAAAHLLQEHETRRGRDSDRVRQLHDTGVPAFVPADASAEAFSTAAYSLQQCGAEIKLGCHGRLSLPLGTSVPRSVSEVALFDKTLLSHRRIDRAQFPRPVPASLPGR